MSPLLKILLIACLLFNGAIVFAQQEPPALPNTLSEQQLENLAETDESETEDDSYLQQYLQLHRHHLNLNEADESDLKNFLFLSPLQIQQFLLYRQLMGKLISIYELQSVPGWDIETIRRLLPYVYAGNVVSLRENVIRRFREGDHTLLLRMSQVLEKQDGYKTKDTSGPTYTGSPQRVTVRYKYQYKNLLQYGITADKDAGEQLFKGGQKGGFDFYSAHLFARNLGAIRYLALGDFTVNMGQGLISWQSLAFRKSADAMSTKRQADILRPYSSPGEFNFHRGAGITLQRGTWQATGFVSLKSVSANQVVDSAIADAVVSSLQSSGYHRTRSELADRNQIHQLSYGGNIAYQGSRLQVGVNAVHHQLSAALHKEAVPYNLYAAGGKTYTNASIDYSYTYKNMHLFGEVATDANRNPAMVHGLLASLDAKVDASLLYRRISHAYSSLYTNAFTESTLPVNENGLYTGITLRPVYGITVSAYADVFNFPWLRYRVDRPSAGSEYLAQFTWRPDKQTELYIRYLNQNKAINLSNTNLPLHLTNNLHRQSWRTHFSVKLSPQIYCRSRVELVWLNQQSRLPEKGFLLFTEVFYKPLAKPLSANIRLQYFETDSYDSRLYAFENDVLYSFSIPPFFGKGYRWYMNLQYDVHARLTLWAKLAQTYMPDSQSIGSGYDRIHQDHRTELRLQAILHF